MFCVCLYLSKVCCMIGLPGLYPRRFSVVISFCTHINFCDCIINCMTFLSCSYIVTEAPYTTTHSKCWRFIRECVHFPHPIPVVCFASSALLSIHCTVLATGVPRSYPISYPDSFCGCMPLNQPDSECQQFINVIRTNCIRSSLVPIRNS